MTTNLRNSKSKEAVFISLRYSLRSKCRRSQIALIVVAALSCLACPVQVVAADSLYQYDSVGRIARVTHPDGSVTVYAYDKANNRTLVNRYAASATVVIYVTGASNLRSLANSAGYSGSSSASYKFVVSSGTTISGGAGGGTAIDTGTWPDGVNLTLVIDGAVYGGGGNAGYGSCTPGGGDATDGGPGGNGINVSAPISITINGTVAGGGGGGGGTNAVQDGIYWLCGGGGGGGAPNGYGSGGSPWNGDGGAPWGGGAGGYGDDWWFGWTWGGKGGDLGQNGDSSNGAQGGGSGGSAGQSIKTNGYTVFVGGTGSY